MVKDCLILNIEGVIILETVRTLVVPLVVIGAINWGLVGLLNLDLVATLLGAGSVLTKVVYIVVGLAGVMLAVDTWGGGKK